MLNCGSFIVHILLLGTSKVFTLSVFLPCACVHVLLPGTRWMVGFMQRGPVPDLWATGQLQPCQPSLTFSSGALSHSHITTLHCYSQCVSMHVYVCFVMMFHFGNWKLGSSLAKVGAGGNCPPPHVFFGVLSVHLDILSVHVSRQACHFVPTKYPKYQQNIERNGRFREWENGEIFLVIVYRRSQYVVYKTWSTRGYQNPRELPGHLSGPWTRPRIYFSQTVLLWRVY